MNGLKALYRILELVPENAADILHRMDEIEGDIIAFQKEVTIHEAQAAAWIKSEFDQFASQVEELINFYEAGVQNHSDYQKIKDHDLTILFSFSEEDTFDDTDKVKYHIKDKIDELKDFLKPLAIEDADTLFSNIQEIFDEIEKPSETFHVGDTLKETYEGIDMAHLQEKVNEVIEQVTDISLTDVEKEVEAYDDQVIAAIDDAVPQVEDHLEAYEQAPATISNAVDLAKKLEPIFKRVIKTLPLQDWGIDPEDPDMKTFWDTFLEKVQQIDTSTLSKSIKTALKTLAEACEENISVDHALHDLSIAIQKLHLIIGYFIDNDLFVPVKVQWLPRDKTIPEHHGLNDEWQTIKAAQAQRTVQGSNAQDQSSSTSTLPTISPSDTEETPTKEDLSKWLSKEHQERAESVVNGDVFETPIAQMKDWLDQLIDAVIDLPDEAEQAWDKKEINNLDKLTNWIFTKIRSLVNDLFEALQSLFSAFLKALQNATTIILDVLLNFKASGDFLQQWAPAFSSLTSVNLFCLVLAVPWESYEKLRKLDPAKIKAWTNE